MGREKGVQGSGWPGRLPNIRMEWRRLREVERNEKERPENSGCVIRLDTRERKVYRDGEVIDEWSQQSFF